MEKQAGFNLLEVAVAIGIMAVGLTGLCALLLNTASGTVLNAQESTAIWLADGLATTVALAPRSLDDLLQGDRTDPACAPLDACMPSAWARDSLASWLTAVAQSLPGGYGMICRDKDSADGTPAQPACDEEGPVVIKVFWRKTPDGQATWARYARRLST